MYVRRVSVKKGSKVYQYTQLVEGFRRPDGTPTNRVVANLGALDDVAHENLRAALAASRGGKAIVVSDVETVARPRAEVHQNLRYLDIAVLLRLWRELDLDGLLDRALSPVESTVAARDVIAALVMQRCIAPDSKLAAERWYPTTALPELQAIDPSQFNNSRIHRALSALEDGEAGIQAALPPLLKAAEGAFTALFVDATDTWFVGHGPPIAQKGRDKEGIYRRRVGLVLLCDQRGYPLRWHTLDGRYHDPTVLLEMAKEAAALSWTKGVPVVMDRAAGNAGATETLHASGLRYVTALPDSELESSGVPIPWPTLDALQAETTEESICLLLNQAGFMERNGRYLLDLGVFEKAHSQGSDRTSTAVASVRLVEQIEAESAKAVAARTGITRNHLRRLSPLHSLIPELRQRILAENVDRLRLCDLRLLAGTAPEEQAVLFDTMLSSPGRSRSTANRRVRRTYPARAVLSVNPERFLSDRHADELHLAKVEDHVDDVNRRLGHRSNRRTDGSALAEVERKLQKYGLRGVFTPLIDGTGPERRVTLVKDHAAWARRRRGDGISVVLAHPDVPATAEALVHQYFAKDAIERDFRTIKSLVELRPVRHRTDVKVRAHVTVCMLALLLVRALEERLKSIGVSAKSALTHFETVRLNLLVQGKQPFYTVTRPGPQIKVLLDTLALRDLTDDTKVGEVTTPR